MRDPLTGRELHPAAWSYVTGTRWAQARAGRVWKPSPAKHSRPCFRAPCWVFTFATWLDQGAAFGAQEVADFVVNGCLDLNRANAALAIATSATGTYELIYEVLATR